MKIRITAKLNLAEGQSHFSKIAEVFSLSDRTTRQNPDSHSIDVLFPTYPPKSTRWEIRYPKHNPNYSYRFSYHTLAMSFVGMTKALGLLLHLITLSETYTPSVRLLSTSYQPIAEISTCQHTTLTRDRHLCTQRG